MDVVEFVMQVEEDFDMEIDETTSAQLTTVKKLCDYIIETKDPQKTKLNQEIVFNQIKKIIVDLRFNEESEIKMESRFVEDLGWD